MTSGTEQQFVSERGRKEPLGDRRCVSGILKWGGDSFGCVGLDAGGDGTQYWEDGTDTDKCLADSRINRRCAGAIGRLRAADRLDGLVGRGGDGIDARQIAALFVVTADGRDAVVVSAPRSIAQSVTPWRSFLDLGPRLSCGPAIRTCLCSCAFHLATQSIHRCIRSTVLLVALLPR